MGDRVPFDSRRSKVSAMDNTDRLTWEGAKDTCHSKENSAKNFPAQNVTQNSGLRLNV